MINRRSKEAGRSGSDWSRTALRISKVLREVRLAIIEGRNTK
jgi:hypothetical protein